MTVPNNESSFKVFYVFILMIFLNTRVVDYLHAVSEKRKSFDVIRLLGKHSYYKG
jgi:hypothetical protein